MNITRHDGNQTVFQKEIWRNESEIKEDDESVPYLYNVITTLPALKQVRISYLLRKKGSLDAAEEIMFDCNELAEGQIF
jgi:oligopeptidase B